MYFNLSAIVLSFYIGERVWMKHRTRPYQYYSPNYDHSLHQQSISTLIAANHHGEFFTKIFKASSAIQ